MKVDGGRCCHSGSRIVCVTAAAYSSTARAHQPAHSPSSQRAGLDTCWGASPFGLLSAGGCGFRLPHRLCLLAHTIHLYLACPIHAAAEMMTPSFCCRALGSADGERLLGVGGHQEVTVVGSYLVLRCLRQAPIGSSISESLRCRNRSTPSDGPQSLWDFALRVANPAIWWSRGESNPRPTHLIVNIWVVSDPTTISLQADEARVNMFGCSHPQACHRVLPTRNPQQAVAGLKALFRGFKAGASPASIQLYRNTRFVNRYLAVRHPIQPTGSRSPSHQTVACSRLAHGTEAPAFQRP